MRLLFVFTGGTIGSTQKNGVISADSSKSYAIISAYAEKYGINFEYDTVEPYTELSENNTGEHIRTLLQCVRARASKYDGVIVTHGTDTLQYTAAALGYTLGLGTPPVCIVAANRTIENADSNALDNLHGAIRFVEAGAGRGVFVVYRNDKSESVRVHRATRLVVGRAYSDAVSSIFGSVYASFDERFDLALSEFYKEMPDAQTTLDPDSLCERSEKILVVYPYPGMVYPEISDGVEFVVLNTYHSGTVDTKSKDALAFFKSAKEKGVKVYATGVYDGPGYESASLFDELGIIPIRNISPVAAYVKLWMLADGGRDVAALISESLSGDLSVGGTL